MESHIFISYSSHDAKIAFKIVEYLEENGIKCWIAPRNIESGLDYTDVINNAIEECSALVLVFSTASIQSQFVKKEITTAVSFNKTILPFKISKVELKGGFLFLLNNVQWIDATSHPESNFPLILNRLNKESDSSSPLPPPKTKRDGKRWAIFGIIALLVLGVSLWLALKGGSPQAAEDSTPSVDTLMVTPEKEQPIEETVIPEEKAKSVNTQEPVSAKKKETRVEKNTTKIEKSTTKNDTPSKESPAKENTEQLKETNTPAPTTSTTQPQSDTREARMKKANSYYNQGKYGPALKIYEKLKQENPSDKSLDRLIKECRDKL